VGRLSYDKDIICIRGGGDLATGVIQKLARSGMRVVVLEIERPTAIRRTVALSTAIEQGRFQVEDIVGRFVKYSAENLQECWEKEEIPIIIDPDGECIQKISPICVVDAILAKKNLGTSKDMAPITIGMGPGFEAPTMVDGVIETMRGHKLGSLILNGCPLKNTGIPGEIGGKSVERVLRSPCKGIIVNQLQIGERVMKGQVVCTVAGEEVRASFSGVLRGILADGMMTFEGMKIGDIDPRDLGADTCFTISDKARNLGGAVLEAFLYLKRKKGLL